MKIEKATKKDLKELDKIKGCKMPKLHISRLEQQKKRKAIYFIAYEKNKPVGHVFVYLKGNENYHSCPTLQDVFVKETERKKGFGRMLMNKVEQKLKNLSYKKIGLDVETGEKWLKKFYESGGYKVIGKIHQQTWTQKDSGKKMITKVWHLEKKLR